jgi:hypothetical protein
MKNLWKIMDSAVAFNSGFWMLMPIKILPFLVTV